MSINDKTAIIIGSSGGIGLAISEELKNQNKFQNILAYSRSSYPSIDITKEKDIKIVSEEIYKKKYNISLLINAVGYLHDEELKPEKKSQDINLAYMKKSFEINSIGPALLIKYFAPLMSKNTGSLFISMSAKVGSISDNYLGGWYSYRASKAALNQIIRTASIEYKRKNPKITFLSLHPGTVSTKLSKPYIGNNNNIFTPQTAAKRILSTLEKININDSGLLVNYDKQVIEY